MYIPHQDVKHHHGGHETSAVGGRQEAEQREHQRDGRHGDDLHAAADQHREHERMRRRTEDVTVHELPAGLLLRLLLRLHLVVAAEVGAQRAHHDHGHHGREEEGDHDRVDDGHPVDLRVGHREVDVPARGPSLVRVLLPLDRVREGDGRRSIGARDRQRRRRVTARVGRLLAGPVVVMEDARERERERESRAGLSITYRMG